MYVDKVILINIKGFKHAELDLSRPNNKYAGLTVFTGDNGSGKSTLLKAIAIALTGREVSRSLQSDFRGWIRQDSENQESKIELSIVPTKEVDEFSDKGKTAYNKFQASVHLKAGAKEGSVELTATQSKSTLVNRGLWSATARGWFSCGYGPFRRVFGASQEATRLMVSPTTERFVTMFQEAASLFEVDQWLRNLNHKKLEGSEAASKQLELLLEVLRDELMPNQITVDRVDSDGLWLKDRHGVQLAWTEMSDGYRAALALLTDIVRHLISTFGIDHISERDQDGKLIITGSGVVMIDEIDAHLHPQWQRDIGFWLKRHFPNIQFLVTTHSPIICQAADDNGLFVLPAPGSDQLVRQLTVEEQNIVISSRPDTILLTAAFGLQNTRSPRAVKGRADYAKLKAKQRAGAILTLEEENKLKQLQLFADTDEEL